VDVGKVELPGRTEILPEKGYRITGSGHNIWDKEDAFQFAARKLSGDLVFRMDVAWVGEGKAKHRKACAMVRQSLDPDAAYADVAVHGDGLVALQYRKTRGGMTFSVPTPIPAPATVQLERDGNVFTVSVARKGQPFQPVGAVTVELADPVYAGLAVCSHNAKESETAILSNVTLQNRIPAPGQARVHEASLEVVTLATGERRLVHRAREPFQAPNWSPDGKTLFINQRGRMYTLPATGGELKRLDTGAAVACNNDHGLSPDGKWLAISSAHGGNVSKVYVAPAAGGAARLVTPLGPSYWHGWSPDGKTLAYCARRGDNFDIYTIPAAGGEEKRLTDAEGLDDGPEYTPDGKYIYFNSERSGLMKIWRMHADGTHQEQMTADAEYADWFPHPSPDGKMLVFLSFDKSVKGHPANKDVVLRLMPLAAGKPKVLATLFGGQGTINVPSWSPDSKAIAFVSYRLVLP
jgi:Tol biopolymer transport system component